MTTTEPVGAVGTLLPSVSPLALLRADGTVVPDSPLTWPDDDILVDLYRRMAVGRRFDIQATALTKQGRLAVYPSSRGQEACQVGAVAALGEDDWLFPTYRDSVAVLTRGVDAVGTLTLFRGDWHLGYDPHAHRVAPQCTPLATNTLHAVGLARAAVLKGESTVALAMLGDGATSEGDTHEALNFASLWQAPVVFLVQNNGYAISVPTTLQSAAPSLAHKGIGYGMRSVLVDGNDAAAVHAVVGEAVTAARAGAGPVLIEARTYRTQPHTNADDDNRYRDPAEVERWRARDPLERLERHLTAHGLLDDVRRKAVHEESEALAADLRARMNRDRTADPAVMFADVYAEPTAALREQLAGLVSREKGGENL